MQAIQALKSQPKTRRADVALYGVYEISKLLTAPGRLEVTLGKVMHLLSSFLDMRHGLIALLGNDNGPEVVVGSGWSEATARRYFEQLPEQAIGRIVVTEMPLVVENMREDALFENFDFSEWGPSADVSFVGVPIKDAGRVIGTLTIDADIRTHENFGFDDDVRFLTMVANLVGQTVRLQRLIARDRERLMEDKRRLERELEDTALDRAELRRGGIVGDSPALRAVLDKVRLVARSNSTVLLRGESGTGKELFARALHDLSTRKDKPFVKVNCAALPESVLESELFGHEKGAFTGASGQRKGRFELADGGTLFLDEIGEISASFQAKLLRVLQEGEFERVGGTSTLKIDVRLVTATNRNLEEAVSNGDFRADLYYRISVVPIFLPPLRERQTDIPLLAHEFLRRFNAEHGTSVDFGSDALPVLTMCQFPGNVRELENCVRRTATLAPSSCIHADDFACQKDECLSAALWTSISGAPARGFVPLPIGRAPRPMPAASSAALAPEDDEGESTALAGRGERSRLIDAMEAAGWVQAKAARLLNVTPRQMGYALRKHDIPIKKF
ncbi:MAG TPA: nif-specific transcriptional activator NifA [Polyangiaceae bacterium]|nr:nif-specific transcriptional activator NifA [Polyangiaceae bacterium]